jgi:hypothetical protein
MIKSSFRVLRRFFGSLYFLVFLNGFLLASLFYFKMEANYENELFTVIQKSINKKIDANDTKDSILVKIMQTCSSLLGSRASIFSGNPPEDLEGFKSNFLHPASIDLMTARGACGSYSLVLARILQNYHYPVRIDQMKANGQFASHNVIEANINTQWVVLDPLFDIYFVKPNGIGLASFNDVKNDWQFYSKQLPTGYNPAYRYEDVRYTNWNKIPVILPAFKKMLDIFLSKESADSICLRVHFLRMYDFSFFVTLFLFIPIMLLTIRKIIKKRLFFRYNMPTTLSNGQKYVLVPAEKNRLKKSS